MDPAAPRERNVWDLLVNPYASSVLPPDLAPEIYQAEGNTVAAQERTQRIALYAVFAVLGVTTAFFNGFLTELRNNPPPTTPDGTALADFLSSNNPSDKLVLLDAFGFAWVHSNVVLTFCFTNQIGGGLALLLGGAAALLAEAEYDTRRTNAEKIYEELVQRRQQRQQTASTKSRDRTGTTNRSKPPSKRRVNSKEAKRLNALSEVVAVVQDTPLPANTTTTTTPEPSPAVVDSTENTPVVNPNPNLLDRVKDLYQQADTMAMTQALLLNQQLEEQGILPKITDETGLKVIPPAARRTNTTNQETTGNATTHDT